MTSSSISTLSLYSNHLQSQRCLCNSLKPTTAIAPPFTSSSLFLHIKLRPTSQIRQNRLIVSSESLHLPLPCVPPNPTSAFSINPSLPALTHKNFKNFLCEKVVFLLIGSFIFMGSFRARPVLAVPAQESSHSENVEERRETQNGKNEDEEMNLKILENDPKNVEALKVVVYGKMRKGKNKEALKYVEKLIDVEPNEVEWRLLQALCYETLENLSKAKKLFREILKQRPLLLRALHGLAMVMHKNHEDAAAFEMLNKALEVARREKRFSEERSIRILVAQMHVVKGDLEEGLKDFQVLVAENPRDFRPYLCQGIIYSLLDKKNEAEEQFEIYRSLVPEEFPQRGFLDDVVLTAKTKSQGQLKKEFQYEFSNRK